MFSLNQYVGNVSKVVRKEGEQSYRCFRLMALHSQE